MNDRPNHDMAHADARDLPADVQARLDAHLDTIDRVLAEQGEDCHDGKSL